MAHWGQIMIRLIDHHIAFRFQPSVKNTVYNGLNIKLIFIVSYLQHNLNPFKRRVCIFIKETIKVQRIFSYFTFSLWNGSHRGSSKSSHFRWCKQKHTFLLKNYYDFGFINSDQPHFTVFEVPRVWFLTSQVNYAEIKFKLRHWAINSIDVQKQSIHISKTLKLCWP